MRIIAAVGLGAIIAGSLVLPGRHVPLSRHNPQDDAAPGQLTIIGKGGKVGGLCPLQGTKVNAEVTGFGAKVIVVQTFTNPTSQAIEAVYTFPLPNDAAVNRMRMKVGSRVIEGEIKKREEARAIYDEARARGQVASLLDQERPNIFTQSVANIVPGAKVQIEITYVQLLKYEEGQFEFNFPMVVGPRFLGNAPDPGKISHPITPKGTRSGANIELTVDVNAGAPIQEARSVLHEARVQSEDNTWTLHGANAQPIQAEDGRIRVSLLKADEIPNRDFILRYRCATNTVQSAFLAHSDAKKGGFFTLILMPPKAPTAEQIAPKEMIFVMDQSGSQSGFPIQKSKELTLKLIKTLRPDDTFNVIGFNNTIRSLWPEPQPNLEKNISAAESFIKDMDANGGTQLREGVIAALEDQRDSRRLRIVVFNTDGFVGDEKMILDTIQKQRDRARMFTFGIGNGVNRYLIDAMSEEGKGDAEYVTLAEAADGAVERFIKRTRTPILTDIRARFEGSQVEQVLPAAIPDVFSEKPVVIYGRYRTPGHTRLVLSGTLGRSPWSQTIDIDLPARADAPAIATLWARRKVDDLTRRNYLGDAYDVPRSSQKDDITNLALEFGIMTEYTSFVAVEQRVVNVGGKQRTVQVTVEMADGVSYEGTVGDATGNVLRKSRSVGYQIQPSTPTLGRTGGGGAGLGGSGYFRGAKFESMNGAVLQQLELSDKDFSQLSPPDRKTALAQRREARYHNRVSAKLRAATGKVEVQVRLKSLDPALIQKLKALGLKVDQKDTGLKILFGSCNSKALIELAQQPGVLRIDEL